MYDSSLYPSTSYKDKKTQKYSSRKSYDYLSNFQSLKPQSSLSSYSTHPPQPQTPYHKYPHYPQNKYHLESIPHKREKHNKNYDINRYLGDENCPEPSRWSTKHKDWDETQTHYKKQSQPYKQRQSQPYRERQSQPYRERQTLKKYSSVQYQSQYEKKIEKPKEPTGRRGDFSHNYSDGEEKIDEMSHKLNKVLKNIKNNPHVYASQHTTPQVYTSQHTTPQVYTSQPNTPSKPSSRSTRNHGYEEMKKSLKRPHYMPREIIIEESSTETEQSPRFMEEFLEVFKKLDKRNVGTLSQINCSEESLPVELKYILGGIIRKVKYRNQKLSQTQFIKECQHLLRQFTIEEIEEVFSKANIGSKVVRLENLPNYKSVLNETYGQQTKRSNEFSEVINKYQFEEERVTDFPILKDLEEEKHGRYRSHFNERKQSFDTMCESLNHKLNNYIESISNHPRPEIRLEFSQLSKHWQEI